MTSGRASGAMSYKRNTRPCLEFLRVISTEGLIGFKLQGLVNDPRRTQAAVTSEREPYEALDDLMSVIEALCPRWPSREISSGIGKIGRASCRERV